MGPTPTYVVCTPAGHPVAIVHANNGASELEAWADVFADFAKRLKVALSRDQVFRILLESGRPGTRAWPLCYPSRCGPPRGERCTYRPASPAKPCTHRRHSTDHRQVDL